MPIHHRRNTDSWLKFIFNGGQISHSKSRLNEMEERRSNPCDHSAIGSWLKPERLTLQKEGVILA
jgi:hypothetical protein